VSEISAGQCRHTNGQVELQHIDRCLGLHELHEIKQNVLVGQNVGQLQLGTLKQTHGRDAYIIHYSHQVQKNKTQNSKKK